MHYQDDIVFSTDVHHLEKLYTGKVRDVYKASHRDLLMIACDRLSAFDVVMPNGIPRKGAILTQMSNFWFERTRHIIDNHVVDLSPREVLADHPAVDELVPRSVVVKRLKPVPIEAIVRGYLAGSGWKDYQATGMLCGHRLPPEMEQAQRLPQPLFTPSTKAIQGHDENISVAAARKLVGKDLVDKIADVSLKLYRFASQHAAARGIIIADTKFEFGLDESGSLVLMDEIFTPDSSRFWPKDQYRIGISPPSFDKQFVRDWLETQAWDKTPPGPELPADIVNRTADRYAEALQRLTGEPLS